MKEWNEETFILIDKYLSKEMSIEESTEFEDRISKDPDLANEIEIQKDIKDNIRKYASLKNRIQQIDTNLKKGKNN